MDREIFIFPVQLTTYRIGNLTRLIHTLAICVTIYKTLVFIFSEHIVKSTLAQSTGSRELHTHRTIADGEKRSPKRARNNPEVPR